MVKNCANIGAVFDRPRSTPHGYDEAHPIVLWDEKGVVVDGHTRLQAAIAAGIDDVPVVLSAFFDEDTAVEYAIHCQRDRRNLSDADMIRWIAEVDKRRSKQEVAQEGGKAGGRGRGDSLTSREVKLSPHHARSSAQQTADIVGTSRAGLPQGSFDFLGVQV